MLQKYFDKIILESIFYYTLQNSSQKQEAEQEKYLKYIWIENWQMCNLKFSESAGWLFIPVAEKYRLLIGKISLVLVRLKYLLKS